MKINYNLIIYKDKFINNEIDEEKLKELNIISDQIKEEVKLKNIFYETKTNQLYLKARDIIQVKPELFNSLYEKNIFVLNTIFDNDKIISYIKSIGITNDELDKLMKELSFNKLYYKKIKINSLNIEDKIVKLMEYLGINNVELLLNKLQQIYYCNSELLKEKQKQLN